MQQQTSLQKSGLSPALLVVLAFRWHASYLREAMP